MDFKVFLSDDALSDLEGIVTFVARQNAVATGEINPFMLTWNPMTFA